MRPSVMSNARSTAASRQRAKFAESPDEARLVDAANLTGEHDRVEPAAALARTDERLVRIESRPRARGHRSNDGGGSRAVRIIVLYDDRRPGLADLRTHRGVSDLSAAWTRYRRRRTGHVSASTAAHSAASRRSRSRFTRPSSSRSSRSRVRVRPRASSRIAWSMNRLRFPFFVTRSSSSTVALGSVMLRRPYARVDAFMRIIPMLHTTDVDPQDPCCRHAVAPTLPRLLRWLLVDGPDPANVAKRAESARAACPRGAGRLQGLLAVLAGDLEGRTAAGGGWVRRRGEPTPTTARSLAGRMRNGSEAPHTGREGVVRPQAPSRSGRYRNVPAQRATRDASRLGRLSPREPAANRVARRGARLPGAAREAAGRLVRLALAARADARGMVRGGRLRHRRAPARPSRARGEGRRGRAA